VAGELLHRDSLGTEQLIRPGQLNLMTAGRGISHAEEPTQRNAGLHGIQLWVAQPERTRHEQPAFEHHSELPHADVATGTARVLVGSLAGVTADARRDTEHFGAELELDAGTGSVPVRPRDEHAIIVLEGAVAVFGALIEPGNLAYLEPGRDEIPIRTHARSRLMLLGGEPFEAPVTMWWNYVARSTAEIDDANAAWAAGDDRFGDTGSTMDRIPAPEPPWNTRNRKVRP
jgi:redox-sensitive bicupin YhaK (pirin superfamily)